MNNIYRNVLMSRIDLGYAFLLDNIFQNYTLIQQFEIRQGSRLPRMGEWTDVSA